MAKNRTTAEQIKVVNGATSVKGVYFTVASFVEKNNLPQRFGQLGKSDIPLPEYKKLAVEFLTEFKTEKDTPEEKKPEWKPKDIKVIKVLEKTQNL